MMSENPEQSSSEENGKPLVKRERPTVSRNELLQMLEISGGTFLKYVQAGVPVAVDGRTAANGLWRINVADFVKGMIKVKLEEQLEVTGQKPRSTLDEAKRKDKQVQADIRELDLLQRLGKMVDIEDVRPFIRESYAVTRSRVLAITSQVMGLSPKQQRELEDAVNDALGDISETKVEGFDPVSGTEAAASQSQH